MVILYVTKTERQLIDRIFYGSTYIFFNSVFIFFISNIFLRVYVLSLYDLKVSRKQQHISQTDVKIRTIDIYYCENVFKEYHSSCNKNFNLNEKTQIYKYMPLKHIKLFSGNTIPFKH